MCRTCRARREERAVVREGVEGTLQQEGKASDHHTPTCVYRHRPGVAVGQSLGDEQGSAAERGESRSSPSLS